MHALSNYKGVFAAARVAAFSLQVSLLITVLAAGAWGQAVLPAYYSMGATGTTYQVTQPSPQVAGSGNVAAGANAADGDFGTFATLKVDATASVGVPVGLLLKLAGTAPAGYRAGVVLANTASGLANVSALGTVTLRTYLNGTAAAQQQEQKVVQASVLQALLLGAGTRSTQLEFSTTKPFDAVEIEFGGVVGIDYTTDIYYAYGVRPGVQTRASGYISRFAAPTGSEYAAASTSGVLCVATDVENPAFVADNDLANFALLYATASVACNPSLRTKLASVPIGGAPIGYYAGFVIGQQSLLDVSVLSGLQLTTYLNGVQQEEKTGLGVLDLTLLPNNKAQLAFAATKTFDAVKIQRVGLLTALDDLEVYYGFGLAPEAFQGINPVLSNFGSPQAGTDYFNSSPQTVSTGVMVNNVFVATGSATLSSVTDPQKAADANISSTDYAVLNTAGTNLLTLANTATAYLEVKLNGTGQAGNRVGMVVSNGEGLLDLDALRRLTVSTYDANNVIIESKSGEQLLNVQLLDGSQRNKVSFMASRKFSYVRLDVTSAASVSSNTRVYYAFAEDVPLLSLQFPLPVELTHFEAKWAGNATELRWATASEKNSRYFVVERSASGESSYEAVGRVAAAGSSTSSRRYQLRDAEAGTLGATRLYYRLRQVDADGQESFSPVVTVGKSMGVAQLEVYPNPVGTTQEVRLDFHNLSAPGGQLTTYAETGQLVSQVLLAETAGRVALPALRAGLYYVVLRDATGQKVAGQRLVVSNH
ncbi:hypothetical protein GCM10022409_48590 [Hymenobacter glaciei]|uniref:Secretion system C-terminal sorting domain-containing protein n=1 Tax=Hymenobacter glaciei TaxID=877209 RepID=A0ABP7UYZ6_9BACT